MNVIDKDTQIMWDMLKKVAAETLDRKRRLGQYAVIWKDGKAVKTINETESPNKP